MKRLNPTDKERLKRLLSKRERRADKRRNSKTRNKSKAGYFGSTILRIYAEKSLEKDVKTIRSKPKDTNRQVVEFPNAFSFFDNPNGTLQAINSFIDIATDPGTKNIQVNQAKSSKIDYGAALLLNVCGELAIKRNFVNLGGITPQDKSAKDIVNATGLPSHLSEYSQEASQFKSFPIRSRIRRTKLSSENNQHSIVATKLIQYLCDCFSMYGSNLAIEDINNLSSLITEVLGNSEEHGAFNDWWVGGYLRNSTQGVGDCHIAILNFGDSIATSLQKMPAGNTRTRIENLIADHTENRNWLLNGKEYWHPNALWTMFALQQGVSKFSGGIVNTRGQGLARMVDVFNEIGVRKNIDTLAQMCLVSGDTWIKFDSKYQIQDSITEGGRKVIAFNHENDLTKPPDSNYVKRLKNYFYGTMVTLEFKLYDKKGG